MYARHFGSWGVSQYIIVQPSTVPTLHVLQPSKYEEHPSGTHLP